jgi:hypothetical protein
VTFVPTHRQKFIWCIKVDGREDIRENNVCFYLEDAVPHGQHTNHLMSVGSKVTFLFGKDRKGREREESVWHR